MFSQILPSQFLFY